MGLLWMAAALLSKHSECKHEVERLIGDLLLSVDGDLGKSFVSTVQIQKLDLGTFETTVCAARNAMSRFEAEAAVFVQAADTTRKALEEYVPAAQPGKRAAQRARQRARAWLVIKRDRDVFLNLLSELRGFSDLILT